MNLKNLPTILFFFGLLALAIATLNFIPLTQDLFYLLSFLGTGCWIISVRLYHAIKKYEARKQQIIE
ncbi:hypothetical protein [Litchfieldia salsa]|uniref:Uncharacterized protein n=1 Tax=Litchfieldia salsa TaxID=930152 RepID=A0A1H0UNT4_9BACI|nr:hypothetical protein [Litchfieldia salsa]SDP67753.1 hypothetical protein SAMN05216565_10558 [Litchfieldia salsa]